MFCSIIIPTIGRPTLSRAVNSVLEQDFPNGDFEVIIVNDSGKPLPYESWQKSDRVQMINTNRRERRIARNTGAAVARGAYLCFLDDDDWLLPNAMLNIANLSQRYADAVWLYGGISVIDDKGNHLGYINSELYGNCFAQIMGGAWAPLQTSFMRADTFFQLSGFDNDIKQAEDDDLCRRFALKGSFASVDQPVACLLRGTGWDTTTDYDLVPEFTKVSRDKVLSLPGAMNRLLASINSAYWHGRIVRIIASTVGWNLKKGHWANSIKRLIATLVLLIYGAKYLISKDFWEAFTAHHARNTLYFALLSYKKSTENDPARVTVDNYGFSSQE